MQTQIFFQSVYPDFSLKISPLPQKLTPEEIKGHLGKCGRLDELRAKLLKVNQCAEKLRQFKESAVDDLSSVEQPSPRREVTSLQLKKFTALDIEVPIR